MGYDYRTAGVVRRRARSRPCRGPRYDLTDTVKAYTARISPSKVILGRAVLRSRLVDLDRRAAREDALPAEVRRVGRSRTYAQAVDLVAANGRRWDSRRAVALDGLPAADVHARPTAA